jgi:cold shock protein
VKEVERVSGEGFVVIHKIQTMTGKIARLTERGFGFITPDNGEKDVFFHARSLAEGVIYDDLKEGDSVTFDVENGPKGPAAANVQRA